VRASGHCAKQQEQRSRGLARKLINPSAEWMDTALIFLLYPRFGHKPGAWCPRFASVLGTLTWVEEHWRRPAFCVGFPISCCPCGLDFDDPNFPQRIVSKAAPLPGCWFFDQSTLHRIAMPGAPAIPCIAP
jgi:hypothetical protein